MPEYTPAEQAQDRERELMMEHYDRLAKLRKQRVEAIRPQLLARRAAKQCRWCGRKNGKHNPQCRKAAVAVVRRFKASERA